jgi:hypothetical protein
MPTKIGIRLVNKDNLYQTNIDTQLGRSTVTALTLKDFVKDINFGSLLSNTSIPGSKIGSGLDGSNITDNTITGNAGESETPRKPGKIALLSITGSNIAQRSIDLSKLETIGKLSVLGSTRDYNGGDVSVIASSASGDVLRRLGDTLGFGSIDASSIAEGTLAVARGGTGVSQPTSGQLLIGNSSGGFTLGTLTQGTNISITSSDASITIAATFPTATASVNGSQSLPSGIIIKWGEVTLTSFAEAAGTVNFPAAFPTNCYQVTLTLDLGNSTSPATANCGPQLQGITRTNFTYYLQSYNTITGTPGATTRLRYMAIGN